MMLIGVAIHKTDENDTRLEYKPSNEPASWINIDVDGMPLVGVVWLSTELLFVRGTVPWSFGAGGIASLSL